MNGKKISTQLQSTTKTIWLDNKKRYLAKANEQPLFTDNNEKKTVLSVDFTIQRKRTLP